MTLKPLTPGLNPAMPHASARSALTRQPTAEERRRSQRVLVRMPVVIHVAGKVLPGNTHTVSAGGATVILKEGISEGTKVTVENPITKNKVDAKVVRPPQMNQEGSLVPVEFVTPYPNVLEHILPAPYQLTRKPAHSDPFRVSSRTKRGTCFSSLQKESGPEPGAGFLFRTRCY